MDGVRMLKAEERAVPVLTARVRRFSLKEGSQRCAKVCGWHPKVCEGAQAAQIALRNNIARNRLFLQAISRELGL
jgi:hypothetical protein